MTCGKCAKEHGVPTDPEGKKTAQNAKNSAKIIAEKRQAAIEYELETGDHTIDLSEAALEAAGLQCISVIEQRIEECKEAHPEGFMLSIYGTSTGSLSIEQEGKMQLTNRGYQTPPIVDVDGRTIAQGVQGAHGPGSESVFDCSSSRVLSKAVEKAAHLHFAPLCDASQLPRHDAAHLEGDWSGRAQGYRPVPRLHPRHAAAAATRMAPQLLKTLSMNQ
ncbi:ATP-dependent DNA helicase PIF1 [Pseudoscourfieldia marina]